MYRKLLLEISPNKILFVAFGQVEDTGAFEVIDLLEHQKANVLRKGPHAIAADFDWILPEDESYEELSIVWVDWQGNRHYLYESLENNYRQHRRMVEYMLALTTCEYLGIQDSDGDLHADRKPGSLPVMRAYLQDPNRQSSDLGAYVRFAYPWRV